MSLHEFVEDLCVWWDYIVHGHPGLPDDTARPVAPSFSPKTNENLGKESPNLYVGKIIDHVDVKCEVISCEENDFRIKILAINWDRLATYMNLEQTYSLLPCSSFKDMIIWEVNPEQMKRSTSQVLLAWEKGSGWYWDLDT